MPTEFLEWDYDNNICTRYKRVGQCNQCGECCKATIKYTAIPLYKNGDTIEGTQEWWLRTDGKGVWNEVFYYGARRYVKITDNEGLYREEGPCGWLTRSNKCLGRLFGDWSAILCMVWPLSPKHIEPFPNCGFSFVEVEHWTIEKEKEKEE